MHQLIVICVALNPFVAALVSYIINWANGSTFLVNDELGKKNGLGYWDMVAVFIGTFCLVFLPPLSLYSFNGLGQRLEKFASVFNAKLKSLVTCGKNYHLRCMAKS